MADAAMRLRSGSDICELGRTITVRIRMDVRVSRGISDTR